MNEDGLIENVQKKIEREKALIAGATQMRAAATNAAVQSQLENQMRDGHRNIQYFESRLRELQSRRLGQGMQSMSLGSNNSVPSPPVHGGTGVRQRNGPIPQEDGRTGYGGTGADYGNAGPGGYSAQLGAGNGIMPPRAPFGPSSPADRTPRARPNYCKLDLIKYDTPYLGPRIQLMLSQLEFKLSVEKQYKEGIEKMIHLYHSAGDRKSRLEAEARRIESTQKIQLLKQSLKRYEDLHIDMESNTDAPDDDSLNTPNLRKPLSGHLQMRIHAIKDVDHATTGRFSRTPDTFVVMKVEDNVVAKTKATRTDRWTDELHDIDIKDAHEIELTVYDKASGDHPLPIGLLWIRIADIVEEMRRKRIETEFNNSGWVSADQMGQQSADRPEAPQFNPPPGAQGSRIGQSGAGNMPNNPGPVQQVGQINIDSWFSLEPVGRIYLTMSFSKHIEGGKKKVDGGLNRKGAVRQKRENVHELYGHKFVEQSFYSIMKCALCEKFLKYGSGMQCADCKMTTHTDCFSKVVTKCISKSNAESDPDEEKINHRIPHRFEPFSNMGGNWCCHCGSMLRWGKKESRKCTECGATCHAQCVHLVPDFCGMSMQVANVILAEIRNSKNRRTQIPPLGTKMRDTLRPNSARPTPPPPQTSFTPPPGQDGAPAPETRYSYPKEPVADQPPRLPPYPLSSGESLEAAKRVFTTGTSQQYPQPPAQQRPIAPPRMSSMDAAAAAAAALSKNRIPSGRAPGPYQRASSDYPTSPTRGSGLATPMDNNAELGSGYPGRASQPQPAQQSTYDPSAYARISGDYPSQQFNVTQPPPPPPSQPGKPAYPASQPPSVQQPAIQAPVPRKVTPPANAAGTGRRIGLDHFNFLAVLGKGNFGKVMLAETKTTKQLYAIKVLKKEFIIENDEVESTRSEKRVFLIANKERHPFLLNLHACFQTETRVYFVMEYISGGDLMLHIQRGQFGTRRAQFYAAEVCLALKYFHENGVIYRDLKLDNILLTLDGHIKIADYGLCKEDMWYGSTTSTFCGTPEFMAPEILLDRKYGRAVDWWAFGVLIYQMLLQQSPFRGEDEDEIYDAILADEPLYPIHMPRDSVSILQKLLTREPEHRLGSGPTDAQEIMSHAFFRGVNWDDVYHKRIPAPFTPTVKGPADTSNFDSEFTSVTPVLTPVQSVLTQAMQEEFRGFSYSADFL